jgi:DNA-binding transcriptional LysR family regulator
MLDWDDLRFLLALSRCGSASAAARQLGVDKATVTRRLSALERAVGTRLFLRRASGWTSTLVGDRLAAHAARAEADLGNVMAELAGHGNLRARVRLTAPLWFCTAILVPHVPELRRRVPWLDLDLSATSRMANLSEREAEVALRNRRPESGDLHVRKAGVLGSALYAARSLVGSDVSVDGPDDVGALPVVGYLDRLTYVPGLDWFNGIRTADRPVLRLDDAQALLSAIAEGLGIGVLPCAIGNREPGLTRLSRHVSHEDIWLVVTEEDARTRAVRVVTDFVAEVFRRNSRALAGREGSEVVGGSTPPP